MNLINEIKKIVEDFFNHLTTSFSSLEVKSLDNQKSVYNSLDSNFTAEEKGEEGETIKINIKLTDPQVFIGQGGQTLFGIQHLLSRIISKKFPQKIFLDLDINDYKKKKIEYLKNLAQEVANEVTLSKKEKELPPMSAFERRIIHLELSQRSDVFTESIGEGENRHIIIKTRP